MEKRRKHIESIFNILFIIYIINIVLNILFKIFYITGLATIDIATSGTIVIYILGTVFMYISKKLAKQGHKGAGIIGIIIGITEVLFAGLLWKIIGAILLINSIIYLIEYKK